jgi:GT2 family glycosyltransferase
MEEALSVAVLVPTHRRSDALERCLAGLAAQERRPDRVIVVARPDDQPTQRVLDAAPAELPLDRVSVDRPGQIAGLNAGLERLREDIVAITDDDCIPRRDWLARIERHFAADPRLGGVGGRDWLRQRDGPIVEERRVVGRLLWYGRFIGLHHLGTGHAREVDFLKGANMSYRRSALAGLQFDTHLKGTGTEQYNDWVFGLAVKASGWRLVFDPPVAVDHYEAARGEGNPRFAATPRVAAEHAHNQTYGAARHLPGSRVLAHLLYSALVGTTTSPGLALLVLNILSGHETPAAGLLRFRLSQQARAVAVRTAVRERRRAGASGGVSLR